jgi:hypothetical protein
MTLRDRALAAGRRFAERAHGKPTVINGTRWYSPVSQTVKLAFASGWLAGWAAARRR